jgi:G3E family GTPase
VSRIRKGALALCRCADFVLLNKVDMLKEGDLDSLSQIAASLNPLAKVGAATLQRERPLPPSS